MCVVGGWACPCELASGEEARGERPRRIMRSAGSSDDSYQCFQL